MVRCLYQRNVYIKRKLQEWRVKKCIPLVGAKTALTCAGRQTTPSHGSQQRGENGNLRKSGSTFRHVYIKRKLQVWRVQKCIGLVGVKTAITCAGRQTTQSHVSQHRGENGNFRKMESTFRHGTEFAPK